MVNRVSAGSALAGSPLLFALAAVVCGLGVIAATLAFIGSVSTSWSRPAEVSPRGEDVVSRSGPPAAKRISLAPDAGAADAIATGILDQASVNLRGTFRAQSGLAYRVYEGTLLPNSPLNRPGGSTGAAGVTLGTEPPPKTCVALRGGGALGLACAAAPFARSSVLFLEAQVGGPEPTARSAFEIAGLVAPGVASVEAVDSNGEVHAGDVSAGHAFFVELSRDELAAGTTIESLRLRSASGDLLGQVDA